MNFMHSIKTRKKTLLRRKEINVDKATNNLLNGDNNFRCQKHTKCFIKKKKGFLIIFRNFAATNILYEE